MKRSCLFVAAVFLACSQADAAVRTFATDHPQVTVTSPNFELGPDWAMTNDSNLPNSGILTPAMINANGVPLGMTRIDYNAAFPSRLFFTFGDGMGNSLRFDLPIGATSTTYEWVPGTDLVDDMSMWVDLNPSGSVSLSAMGNTSVTIGTAAIPEPSAFGFGALAIAATGLGRWVRNRWRVAG